MPIVGHDTEGVVEQAVGADALDTELVAHDLERAGQVVTDGDAARAIATQQELEVLGADDRPPRSLDPADHATGIHRDLHDPIARTVARRDARPDRRRQRTDRTVDGGQAGDRVDVVGVDVADGVDVRAVGHGEDVPAAVVERLERVARRTAMHEVAGRAVDRTPRDRHLPATTLGADAVGRWQDDVRCRPVPLGLGAERLEPGDTRGPRRRVDAGRRLGWRRVPGAGHEAARRGRDHGTGAKSIALRGPALNRSIPMIGRRTLRTSLVANESRRMSSERALPMAAMTIPWSSDR